jgi:uncharacterized membrane protein
MGTLEIIKIFFGGLFVLFIPGLAWSYVFFTRKDIDWIERAALSFGLSIALVPLTVFWLNWLFHIKITFVGTSLTICGLIIVAGIIVSARKYQWDKNISSNLKSVYKQTVKEIKK